VFERKMFFQLKELLKWLGLTVFEIWVGLLFFTVFTVLLTLKVEKVFDSLTWWQVFSPLFISDALNSYFCVIVFIRMYLEGAYKSALIRALWSQFMIALLFVFKYLLSQRLIEDENNLESNSKLEFSEVMSPIFILLQLVMIRACQLH
jgi:ribonuclease P/MRP protein subunit RPP20